MRKSCLAGLCAFLFLACLVPVTRAQLTSLTEGFDTVGSFQSATGIFAEGWVNVNNSDVPNTTAFNWEQGDSGTFIYTAQSPPGSTTSFIQDSFLSTNGTVLSDWLLTPVLTLEAGATISFYTTAVEGTTFANDLQVYISTSGSSTSVGTDAQTPTGGVFTLLPGGDLQSYACRQRISQYSPRRLDVRDLHAYEFGGQHSSFGPYRFPLLPTQHHD